MPAMFEAEQQAIEAGIRLYCQQHDIPLTEVKWGRIPFAGEWGISTSFFATAAAEARSGRKGNVPQRAQELAEQVRQNLAPPPGIARMEAVKGYLNLYFSTPEFARRVVDQALVEGPDFGRGAPRAERVMVEYAQPNTHHSFHIGHYRNTILGESLARLVQFAGFDTVRASYPGDIGLGVISILWAYDKFYKGQEPPGIHERGQWLLKIYSEATALLEPKENETPEEKGRRELYDMERRELYRKWDAGDPEVRQLWLETREWSMEELRDILRMLDVKIDVWFYESEVDEPSKAIVDELIEKGIAEDERSKGGPVIVKIDEKLGLTKEKYRTAVILRSDGTTLYLTKDLALAKVKFEQYHVDRSIYVVDFRQNLHFEQVFKILELWGFAQAAKCHHLSYGYVTLPEGGMSARRGRVVLFMDVAREAVKRVLAVESEKSPDLSPEERQRVANQIGLGALAYSILSVDNGKDIVFDMDNALSFDGHTGPYIQNAHVRAAGIMRKAGSLPAGAGFDYELDPHEVELIELLSRFPEAVQQAASEYRPLVMANYAYDLADSFHSFYHAVEDILGQSEPLRNARLRLVAAAKQVICNALSLLDIQSPEVM
ncbi:MAG TPA: arginine--tRNA ligase [Anaerolineales bacterium]|nr:arginine--tRNA ligase [Anaerolineales bacterium]